MMSSDQQHAVLGLALRWLSRSRKGLSTGRAVSAGAVLLTAMFATATPAHAIDCRRAVGKIDRAICSDQALRSADAAMTAAYAAILKAAGDAEERAALVASQRRWLATRNKDLGNLDQDDVGGPARWREILLSATVDRMTALRRRAPNSPRTFRLIATLRDQRRFLAGLSGGPFAGFDTSCNFLPSGDHYVYACFGRQRYQHKDRVCTTDQEWASGSVSEARFFDRVINGKLQSVATCSIGGGRGPACPDPAVPANRAARWGAASGSESAPSSPLPQLDADVDIDTGAEWLAACLHGAAIRP